MTICGIDYGSKLAGTTVIASLVWEAKTINLISSRKGQDADRLILNYASQAKPGLVCIDAPLSLPGVYTKAENYTDYFFRKADRELQAMSPMFFGGLTARAMQLKRDLEALPMQVFETYPAAQARRMYLQEKGYKQQLIYLPDILSTIEQELHPAVLSHACAITNWHQVDALLALIGGIRFYKHMHLEYGNKAEGIIIV